MCALWRYTRIEKLHGCFQVGVLFFSKLYNTLIYIATVDFSGRPTLILMPALLSIFGNASIYLYSPWHCVHNFWYLALYDIFLSGRLAPEVRVLNGRKCLLFHFELSRNSDSKQHLKLIITATLTTQTSWARTQCTFLQYATNMMNAQVENTGAKEASEQRCEKKGMKRDSKCRRPKKASWRDGDEIRWIRFISS